MDNIDAVRIPWLDLNLKEATSLLYVSNGVSDANVIAGFDAINNCSAATGVTALRERKAQASDNTAGASGSYATHLDMATLEFRTLAGDKWPITIVAPLAEIFLTGTAIVNQNHGLVDAVISWALLYARTNSGDTMVKYVRGWRWRMPAP